MEVWERINERHLGRRVDITCYLVARIVSMETILHGRIMDVGTRSFTFINSGTFNLDPKAWRVVKVY